jgi:hypothetical protein
VNTEIWLIAAAALAIVLALVLVIIVLRRRRRKSMAAVIKAISIDARTDVSLPDGNDGLIHVEHLIFTARGLLVLDTKSVTGVIFATDGMAEWTAIEKQRRFAFRNPQPALLDRVAALRLIAKDIPVSGHVAFLAGADFSKGRPTHVIHVDELLERYGKPGHAELERIIDAFSPQWERVLATCEPSFNLAGD